MESQPFKHILPNDIQYFRYIDDILIIYPKEHSIPQIVQKLIQVEPSINFKYELEKNNSLLFLDILLINNNNKLEFKVYHKINNKNAYKVFMQTTAIKQKANHTFDFQNSVIFALIHDKNKRRIIEACSIAHQSTIPQRQGFFFQNFTIYRKNNIRRIQNSL